MCRRAETLRKLSLLCGAILLSVLLWRLGPGEILRMLGQIGWHSLPIVLFFVAYQAGRAAALWMSAPRTGVLRYWDALWIRFSGEAIQVLTLSGPFLAEPAKAWLLERRGLTLREGFAGTITEYLVCTFVTAAMSIAGLLFLKRYVELAPVIGGVASGLIYAMSAFLIVAAIAILLRVYLIGSVIGWLGRVGVLRGRLRPDIDWINRMEDLLLAVLHDQPKRLAGIVLIEIGAQVFLVLEVLWVLRALDLAAPAAYPLVIEAATKFISLVFFFIPTQVGAAEGTYAIVFNALALPATAGFALAFIRRVRTLLVAAVGLGSMSLLTRARDRVMRRA